MYPKFIEVTCKLGDEEHRTIEKRIINVDHIVAVSENIIHCGKDGTWYADESYDELKALIKDSGCLIRKADPRLDTEHPLTMDDLMTMVGEPVWNSNTRDWWLIHYYMEYPEFDVIIVYNKDGVQESWYREDLIKTPLYRIRQ